MADDTRSLIEERARVLKEARELNGRAEKENRDLSGDEKQQYDAMLNRIDELRSRIERAERLREEERKAAEIAANTETRRGEQAQGGTREERMAQVWETWLRSGHARGAGADEFRALQADADTEGGYLVAPEQWIAQLIKDVDDQVMIRQLATKYQVPTAASLGVPTLEADPADADWTSELGTGSEDSAMSFGKRALHPRPLAKRLKVSAKLLRVSTIPVETLVRERLAYKFAITEEKHFLVGDGSTEALGVFTASADGIPTSRDVSTGNTTTGITFDGLIEAKYSVKGQYWPRLRWMFHRDAMKQIAKLKDGEGQYIWRESTRAGEPDRILGMPAMMSEYVPNTFTTGLYVGILGDFSHYWIADALSIQIQRLDELYAETNQVGFIARHEVDGQPVLAEAFARVKLA